MARTSSTRDLSKRGSIARCCSSDSGSATSLLRHGGITWKSIREVDGRSRRGSGWSGCLKPEEAFDAGLERIYDSVIADPRFAIALADRYPLEVRAWGETEVLARWAEATRKADSSSPPKKLESGFVE